MPVAAVVSEDDTLGMLPIVQEPCISTSSLEVEREVLAAIYPIISQPWLTIFPQNVATLPCVCLAPARKSLERYYTAGLLG